MSLLLDKTYANLISHRLKLFEWVREDVASFRCPVCGDSKKSEFKKRGFFHPPREKKDGLIFSCRNCGATMGMWGFLEWFDADLFGQYRLERFTEKHGDKKKVIGPYIHKSKSSEQTPKPPEQPAKPSEREFVPPILTPRYEGAHNLLDLGDDHMANQYVRRRQIPEQYRGLFLYTMNWRYLLEVFGIYPGKSPSDERLVIPFYDLRQNLIALQGRAFGDTGPRYLTMKLDDANDKVYGLERVDPRKPVIVVEGPIDSLFLDNALASADSDLTKVPGHIYLFDNQPRNKEIVNKIELAIKKNKRVVLWDQCRFPGKDVNDMALSGATRSDLMTYIMSNSPRGLEASLRFKNWRRI